MAAGIKRVMDGSRPENTIDLFRGYFKGAHRDEAAAD
jgi:hypothetical protein